MSAPEVGKVSTAGIIESQTNEINDVRDRANTCYKRLTQLADRLFSADPQNEESDVPEPVRSVTEELSHVIGLTDNVISAISDQISRLETL